MMKRIKRRDLILGLGALSGAGLVSAVGGAKLLPAETQRSFQIRHDAPLRQQAAAKGLIYGAATRRALLEKDPEFSAHFVKECAMLVPESELKWKALRPSPERFDFTQGDWLVNFAQRHNLRFRGHTLVWHVGIPQPILQVLNRRTAEKMLIDHVTTVVKHYAGKVHSWDVVNEAIFPRDGRADGLRKTIWLETIGPDYLDLAFRAAAAADPKALLVYNDFGLDYDTPNANAKRDAVLKLLATLKAQGTPIHALGIQAHLMRDQPRFNPAKFQQFLQAVSRLGLKLMITELDVTDKKLPGNTKLRDYQIAAAYEDYLSVALEEPAVIAVLTWGLSDRYTWLTKDDPRPDGQPVRPLPLDAQMKRKLAWNAIARSFAQAPRRTAAF